jgi:membrane-bound lytic murein transglycosylase D
LFRHFLIASILLSSSGFAQLPDHSSFFPTEAGDRVENGVPFVADFKEDAEELAKFELPEKSDTTEDSAFTQDIDEDTPVTHDEIAGEKELTNSRPWQAPDFSNQEKALGYSPKAFAVPPGLEVQVKFWIDVYSKYTTDQGVLHDSENVDLIYDELDFTPISQRTDLNIWQKEALKVKMVKEGKKKVIALLEKLHALKSPDSLNAKEKKIWEYFDKKIDEPKKFLEASKKNRLRFQLGQKDRVIQGIYFSGRYLTEFEKIFREMNLPIELARLPFVESSYNVLARSKVGASGLWQIMPYTMKGFMKRDPSVDLRNHPIEATKTAAKLLRNNYNMLKSWPLALTGYNHGPTGVLRLTKKYKTKELGELVQNVVSRKRFGFASRNFYASFLGVLEVTKNAPKYLGTVTWSQPLDAADITLPISITYRDILTWFDGDDLKAQVFNPHLTRAARAKARPIPKGFVISVPSAIKDKALKDMSSQESMKKARMSVAGAENFVAKEAPTTYKVRRGDTVQKIAKKLGATVQEILKANSLSHKSSLRIGQVLKIP